MNNSFYIRHQIKNETITFEKNRNVSKMDRHSLLWCFAANILFIDKVLDKTLLELEEVSLIGFASQLFDAFNNITNNDKQVNSNVMINDFNGAFQIMIKSNNGLIEINEPHKNVKFSIKYDEFKVAIFKWFNTIDVELLNYFPEIQNNINYLTLEKEFLKITI